MIEPRSLFPSFYDNAAIKALAGARRWTVSGRLGELDRDEDADRKAPVDIRHLIDHGRIRGAFDVSPACLVDLDELTRELPDAANAAFHLQAHCDGLLVIDVESACPADLAADLLRLPGIAYSELSMSGRGLHLLAPLPTNFHDFPVAAGKTKLRQTHGWYEILIDHWCTFTRNPVPGVVHAAAPSTSRAPYFASVEELYAALAATAPENAAGSAAAIVTPEQTPAIAYAREIIEQTLALAAGHLKTPDDFGRDMSRYEFSVLASLHRWLRWQISEYSLWGIEYSTSDVTFLLYHAAVETLPPRAKHSQTRNGRPYLLDRAASLVADREATATHA